MDRPTSLFDPNLFALAEEDPLAEDPLEGEDEVWVDEHAALAHLEC